MRAISFLCVLVVATQTQALGEPVLYGMSVTRQMLVSFDTESGQPTDVGSVGTYIQDIGFNTSDGFLYGYDYSGKGRLQRIDPGDGATLPVGPPLSDSGFSSPHGMTYDANTDQLYVTTKLGDLLRVDPYTGDVNLVGTLSEHVWGLAFDASTETLFGWGVIGRVPVRVSTKDASVTVIGDGQPIAGVEGLTFDSETASLYAVLLRNPNEDSILATVDPENAEVTEIGDLGTDDFISGLAITPEPTTFLLVTFGCAALLRRNRA